MNGATSEPAANADSDDLRAAVLREVLPVFQASVSPKLLEADVSEAVRLLFKLLEHRIGDQNLDGVGAQVIECFARRFRAREHVKIADRFEPFAKFLLKLIHPARYAALAANLRNRFTLGEVLREFALAEESEMKAWSACPWQQFPPADLQGKPDFKEQVGWTLRFRNTEDHLAPELDDVREAKLVQSVCVCFVWLAARFKLEIRSSLTRARFSDYLHKVRDDENFAPIARMCVELTARFCSPEEYRLSNPLLPLVEAPSGGEEVEVSKLPELNRVTVIEAEAGAGKTTTLKLLAWQQAGRLLDGAGQDAMVPASVRLRSCSSTIKSAVEQNLVAGCASSVEVPWDSLLLLVDGLNEVEAVARSKFQAELENLLFQFPGLRIVVAGRLNSFRGEYKAAVVQLQPLNEQLLFELFRKVLRDDVKATAMYASIVRSDGLSKLARVPFYAATLVKLAQGQNLATLTSHAAIVRRCVRDFLKREEGQASTGVKRTDLERKELLLARLAFKTKSAGGGAFSWMHARKILAEAKADVSPSLGVLEFLEEVCDNHLLDRTENGDLEFAHDLYHDYFAARKLEADEQSQKGLGTEFALAHFAEQHWHDCIRLFASLTGSGRGLIERGAEKQPYLAWCLLGDADIEDSEMRERLADAAYCALTCDLRDSTKAALAEESLPVLAAVGSSQLLAEVIFKQRRILKPSSSAQPSEKQQIEEEQAIQAAKALGRGLLSVLRLGTFEQRAGQEGRFCEASHAAVRALRQIKAGRMLMTILASWTGKTFVEESLVPGSILQGLIELGVDEVLDEEIESLNKVLADWLKRASEVGFAKAWPAYGRILATHPGETPGVERNVEEASKWLRKSHENGDARGSLELALLLIEEPSLATEVGEGERLLRNLANTSKDARYELGKLLMTGNGIPEDQPAGFEILLTLAEAKHSGALGEMRILWSQWLVVEPQPWCRLPSWAVPFEQRLKAVFARPSPGT